MVAVARRVVRVQAVPRWCSERRSGSPSRLSTLARTSTAFPLVPKWPKSAIEGRVRPGFARTRIGSTQSAPTRTRGTQQTHHRQAKASRLPAPGPPTRRAVLSCPVYSSCRTSPSRLAPPRSPKSRKEIRNSVRPARTRPSTGFQASSPYDGRPSRLCAHQRPTSETSFETLPSERTANRSRPHRVVFAPAASSSSAHRRSRCCFPNRITDRSYRRRTVVYSLCCR